MSIFVGNCVDKMKDMNSFIYDVIVTSPPYNNGTKYDNYADSLSWSSYEKFANSWVEQVYKVLTPKGSLFLNIGVKPAQLQSIYLKALCSSGLIVQNTIVWVKHISVAEDKSFGHFKPVNSNRYINNCFELIYHCTIDGDVPLDRLAIGVEYADKSNISRWSTGNDKRCRGNVWFVPYKTIRSKSNHPAGFPSRIPEMCILLHGVERCKRILDPFMGVGSTLRAAKKLNIDCDGIELSPSYVGLAEA